MSVDIQLKYPLNDGGVELVNLTMRRPKVRDMLAGSDASKSDAENEIRMFANLCDITVDLIESMDLADYKLLQGAYTDFLG